MRKLNIEKSNYMILTTYIRSYEQASIYADMSLYVLHVHVCMYVCVYAYMHVYMYIHLFCLHKYIQKEVSKHTKYSRMNLPSYKPKGVVEKV